MPEDITILSIIFNLLLLLTLFNVLREKIGEKLAWTFISETVFAAVGDNY